LVYLFSDLNERLKKDEETLNYYLNSSSLNQMREDFDNKYKLLIKTYDIFEQRIDNLTKENSKQFLELKKLNEKNEDLDRRLKKLEEKNADLDRRLKISGENLNETRKELKIVEKISLNNCVFKEKSTYYHLFTDVDGKNKAIFIPLGAMKNNYNFDDSVKLCKKFNSDLIEIESSEKQIILESFLSRIDLRSYFFQGFWLNGKRSSDTDTWKWLKSGKEFTFTNYYTDFLYFLSEYDHIIAMAHTSDIFGNYYPEKFGKWYSVEKTTTTRVICEITF